MNPSRSIESQFAGSSRPPICNCCNKMTSQTPPYLYRSNPLSPVVATGRPVVHLTNGEAHPGPRANAGPPWLAFRVFDLAGRDFASEEVLGSIDLATLRFASSPLTG
jgi:hypothetical protein